MNALVRTAEGVACRDRGPPEAGAGDELVEVELAGICRTDLFVASGLIAVQPGRVLGHECVGRVVRSETPERIGRRVALVPVLPCGRCRTPPATCAAEPERCAAPCHLGIDADGAFADVVAVPRACAVEVAAHVEPRAAAMLEPLAAALAVLPEVATAGRVGVPGEGRIADLVARCIEIGTGCAPERLRVDVPRLAALDSVVGADPFATALDAAELPAGLARADSSLLWWT